jgi:hypothetical protein
MKLSRLVLIVLVLLIAVPAAAQFPRAVLTELGSATW